jgi:flagellin
MALSILNNISALTAQNQLSITQKSLQTTLTQLSSGLKINSGADDAAGLSIANGMQANIAALTQSAQNATNGTGMLQTADGALSQITNLLNRAVTLATEASNGGLNATQSTALNTEFKSILNEIDSIGTTTTFNGAAIFKDGTVANNNQESLTLKAATPMTLSTTIAGAAAATITADDGAGALNTIIAANGTLKSATTVGQLIDAINGSGTGVMATLDSNGALVVTDTQNRGSATHVLTLSGITDGTNPLVAATPTNSNVSEVFQSDSTTVGVSTIKTALNKLNSANLNGVGLYGYDLTSTTNAQKALTQINLAIGQVAALRGNIGANINQLSAAANVMSTQSQNLKSAMSGITDADVATTVANMTKYNILQSTGMAALQQANQSQQSVLKLLQ